MSNFNRNDIPIIIIDEYDRIEDDTTKTLMSETIKQLSNSNANCTIVLVGVAESVTNLIELHQSVARALIQVRMPRMKQHELQEIVTKRLRRTTLQIGDDALWRIAFLSSGLPFYAHALGQAAALRAIDRKAHRITEEIVNNSIPTCFKDLDHTLIDSYVKATVETRKGNIFKQVLAACALSEQDDLGRFSAASVEAPLTSIIGREMKGPSFSFHLNELCKDVRGNILHKSGQTGHFRFRFIDPIMQPYITMRSLSDDIIANALLERFAAKRQRRFSTDF